MTRNEAIEYTPEQKRDAIELMQKRLLFNIQYDLETLYYRSLGLLPPIREYHQGQAISILESMKDKEAKDE